MEAYAGDRRIPREEAARLMGYPSVPRAFAGPDLRSVWMYLDGGCLTHPVSLDNLRCSIKQRIYHELFHVWTFQFGMAPLVEKERAATEWLNEGLADFASYLGIQRLGMFSLQDILLYVRRQAMNYEPVSRLSELDFTWGNFEPAYHVSALAIFRLAGNEPARITTFLRHPNFRQDWRRAFELTFGRSVPAFEMEFKADLEAIVADGRRVTLRIIGDGKIVPGTRVGLARVGMSVESLIAEIGPPDGSGTAAGGSRRLQWTLQERAYREATHGTARLLIWTGANGARVEQAIAYSGAFRTPGGNTVTSPLTALLQEFPARRVQPAGSGFEWAFGDGISFLYRVPSRAILAIGVGR
ncbi:MAG: hypothetical protein HY660_15170 [Armatimonadetes bacterium]|nr:hypothetical protein [Armatimonadota bacterium]